MEHQQEVEMTGTDWAKVMMTKVDQLVERGAEVGVKAREKYKTAILPHLQQLAGELQTQSMALQLLVITVEVDLERVKNKVNMAASDIEQNCDLVEQLTEVNKEIVSSHVKLEQSLDMEVTEYKIYKEGVDNLGQKVEVLDTGLGTYHTSLRGRHPSGPRGSSPGTWSAPQPPSQDPSQVHEGGSRRDLQSYF
jgi:hypothetical protein